jgi:hypothetical protein
MFMLWTMTGWSRAIREIAKLPIEPRLQES